jgi:hypothetical protein
MWGMQVSSLDWAASLPHTAHPLSCYSFRYLVCMSACLPARLMQVIPGLDEALLTMSSGCLRRLYIPGNLAFPKGLPAGGWVGGLEPSGLGVTWWCTQSCYGAIAGAAAAACAMPPPSTYQSSPTFSHCHSLRVQLLGGRVWRRPLPSCLMSSCCASRA